MQCSLCGSVNRREFIAEMRVRSPGLENIDEPPVLLFPKLFVCLDCCMAGFAVPEDELRKLVQDNDDDSEVILCRGRGSCDG